MKIFNFFKRKTSDEDNIVNSLINRLNDDSNQYEIIIGDNGVLDDGVEESGKYVINANYKIVFNDTIVDIAMSSKGDDIPGEPVLNPTYTGWDLKTRNRFIEEGAVRTSDYIFYKLKVDGNIVQADWYNLQKLFNLTKSTAYATLLNNKN
jgi:hypothetical protein